MSRRSKNVRPRFCRFFLIAIAVTTIPTANAVADDDLVSADDARRQVIDRLSNLQNIIVEYEETVTYQPLPELLNEHPKQVAIDGREYLVTVRTGSEKSKSTFRFLSGHAWYERHLQEVEPRSLPRYIEYSVDSFREEQLERLWRHEGGVSQGMIDPYPSTTDPPSIIDVALGLRLLNTSSLWLSPEDVRHYGFEPSKDGRVVVKNLQFRNFERQNGELVTSEILHEWVFDAKQDFALLRYRRIVDEQLAQEVTMGSFGEVDGMMLPTEIRFRNLYHRDDDEPHETTIREVVVTRYALNPAENTRESFAIEFPENADVLQVE